MAPLPMKSIVSVSSEDKLNPASNLLSPSHGGKWLCAPQNKTRTAEVVIELSKRAKITSVQICNFGSAFVEVLVSDSSSPDQYLTLLHMCMLMSLQESRTGRNKNKTAVYSKGKLSATATSKKWNRLKIRCVQKYNLEAQFGLRAISLFPSSHDPNSSVDGSTASSGLLSPESASSPPLLSPTMGPLHVDNHNSHHKQQKSKLSSPESLTEDETRSKTQTPKRPSKGRNATNSEGDFEFSGVEKQSRLFRECMKGKSNAADGDKPKASNHILERISAEKEKYAVSPQRKKLLKKELPKAEVMRDFVESYKEKKGSMDLTRACRRMASHDNDYEIGEEPEMEWGWDKFKGKPRLKGGRKGRSSPSGQDSTLSCWISKRKKLDNMIDHCSDILERAGHGESPMSAKCSSSEEIAPEKVKEDACDDLKEDSSIPAEKTDSLLVECPLCMSFFPSYAIEVHASACGEISCHAHTSGPVTITLD